MAVDEFEAFARLPEHQCTDERIEQFVDRLLSMLQTDPTDADLAQEAIALMKLYKSLPSKKMIKCLRLYSNPQATLEHSKDVFWRKQLGAHATYCTPSALPIDDTATAMRDLATHMSDLVALNVSAINTPSSRTDHRRNQQTEDLTNAAVSTGSSTSSYSNRRGNESNSTSTRYLHGTNTATNTAGSRYNNNYRSNYRNNDIATNLSTQTAPASTLRQANNATVRPFAQRYLNNQQYHPGYPFPLVGPDLEIHGRPGMYPYAPPPPLPHPAYPTSTLHPPDVPYPYDRRQTFR